MLGSSEDVILEMDRLASEDHSHIATEEVIDVYRGNWWIRSNLVDSDTMPIRRRPDFTRKRCRLCMASRKRRTKMHNENWPQSSSSWWQWHTTWWHPYYERPHHKDGVTTDRTWKLVNSVRQLFICGMNLSKEFGAQFTVIISVTAESSLLSPTVGVKRIPPDTAIHEQLATINGYVKVCTATSTLIT